MASKSETSSGSKKSAAGEKGVTQAEVGSGKEKDPNNLPTIGIERPQQAVKVDNKATSEIKAETEEPTKRQICPSGLYHAGQTS